MENILLMSSRKGIIPTSLATPSAIQWLSHAMTWLPTHLISFLLHLRDEGTAATRLAKLHRLPTIDTTIGLRDTTTHTSIVPGTIGTNLDTTTSTLPSDTAPYLDLGLSKEEMSNTRRGVSNLSWYVKNILGIILLVVFYNTTSTGATVLAGLSAIHDYRMQ